MRGRLGRDGRRMCREPRVKDVGIEFKGFAQLVEREMAGTNAVVAAKHLAEDCLRTLAQRRQVAGRNERVPALRLCPAWRRRSGADPAQEHPLNLAEKSLSG